MKDWYLSSQNLIPIIWNVDSCCLKLWYLSTDLHAVISRQTSLNLTHDPEKDFKVTHTLKSRKSSSPAAGNNLLQAPYSSSWFTEFWKQSSNCIKLRTLFLYQSSRTWYARLTTAWKLLSLFVELCCDVRRYEVWGYWSWYHSPVQTLVLSVRRGFLYPHSDQR
jgi:hypothetical protein